MGKGAIQTFLYYWHSWNRLDGRDHTIDNDFQNNPNLVAKPKEAELKVSQNKALSVYRSSFKRQGGQCNKFATYPKSIALTSKPIVDVTNPPLPIKSLNVSHRFAIESKSNPYDGLGKFRDSSSSHCAQPHRQPPHWYRPHSRL
jgi:hypothetical protein